MVKKARARYHTRRQRLQKVHTKNAKRRLRKNAGRERRFQKDINHCIAKALVNKAVVSCKALALEDLREFESGSRFATNSVTSGIPGPSPNCANF